MQTGIVYCLSKKDTESVCEELVKAVPGMRSQITFYHADLQPQEKEKRQKEELFQIEKTVLIPDKEPEELPDHPWTEEELKAKTLLKKKEEVLKKVPE